MVFVVSLLVFETGIRQFRMAMAMVNGRRIKPQLIQRLVADADATLREFGSPGDDVDQLLDGPFADPETRTHFQTQGLRRTARRLAKRSPFYAARFSAAGLDPRKVDLDSITSVPVTAKAELVAQCAEFLCTDSSQYLSTRTTGTTGAPAEVWLSRYEAELWPAMAALSGLLRNEINHTDCLQINLSSRATAAVQHDIEVCRLVGARSRALGLVSADQSIDGLLGGDANAATILGTYPSYLARLVTAARRRGLGPADFALRRIDVAGEMLSHAVATAAHDTFGVRPSDTFAMTEVLPVSGRTCGHGHLHLDLNMGLVEVIALDGSGPAAPGELGTMVITPFFPYRECMPVFRYDTRDVVRRLPDEPLTCNLAGVPALSAILGKADQLVPTASGFVTPRDIIEVLEGLPARPWPAQYRATTDRGVLRLTVPTTALAGTTIAELARRLAARGINCVVDVTDTGEPLRHVRADLSETTFTTDRTPAGV
jgi:phenylacetate-coenzyme A ligase PaaK-like adenylate-forming protein